MNTGGLKGLSIQDLCAGNLFAVAYCLGLHTLLSCRRGMSNLPY